MKVLIFFVLIFYSLLAKSQNDSTGIYLSATDFKNSKLSLSSPCTSHKNVIKLGGRLIIVKIDGQKFKLAKSEVFGVRTCYNTYRIQGNSDYRIINTDLITLYSQSINTGSESSYYEDVYFFSVNPVTEIIPLTKGALRNAFPENLKFLSDIDMSFKNDGELGTFNKQLNKFMLIYFYAESLK
jgi:hypothetical protein